MVSYIMLKTMKLELRIMESTNSASVTVAKSAEACVSCSNFSKMSCGRVKRTLRGELSGLISNLTTQLISHDSGSCDNSHDWQTPRLSKVRGSWFLEATDFCNPQGRQRSLLALPSCYARSLASDLGKSSKHPYHLKL